jgi:DegV family protein with EDD domain
MVNAYESGGVTMVNNVKIITDSAADLPKDVLEQYDIDVIPLQVLLGEQTFLDGVTLESKKLFDGMREGKVYKTSQPALGDVLDIFNRYVDSGRKCVYVAFSSELSGTYQSGVMAYEQIKEEHPGFELNIYDTKCASLGFGLVVLHAAKLAQAGKSAEEIVRAVEWHSQHMKHIFTVDQLDYLMRGGRVSPVAAFIGGILNIKPILHVDQGKLVPLEKVRGRKKVLQRIVEMIGELGVDLPSQTIGISHGDDLEIVEQLKQMLTEAYGCRSYFVNMIGGAVGAHAGPGTLAVFFLDAPVEQGEAR